MAYWIITTDHVHDPINTEHGFTSRVGYRSAGYTGDGSDLPHHWRVYDDDHELYYEGRASEETFLPLDWAKGYAGATEIHYRQSNGTWEQL